ncbi:hypothetical protein [Methylobacterium aquaticum]|uniref:Uncharacterized protein n=1 Tax=Methylobacterium aquaticum TaxID=270351 RepID=A0A0C6FCE9_9HYPH|nr:hypothetical protein [Methylobacterium aquaticum]BAQ50371.1 hypothetical protein Maq22A_4p60065 [Methylobacterium aquaticum]
MPRCSHTMRVGARDGSVSCGDCGKVIEAAPRFLIVPGPARQSIPEGISYVARDAHCAEIAARHPRSRKLLVILSTLANGALPWGVEWERFIPRHGDEWILCCGHVLGFKEAQAIVSAGLLTLCASGPSGSLTITPAGREWLVRNWTPTRKPRATRTSYRPEPFEEDPNPTDEMRAAVEGDFD